MPTAVAAVVVIAAGVATGVVVGGKSSSKTKTVTVAAAERTVTVTVPAQGEASTTTPASPAPTGTTPSGGETPSPTQHVPLDATLVTIDDSTRSTAGSDASVTLENVEYDGRAQLQQGPGELGSMTFDFGIACCDDFAADYYQFEVTVPEGATKFATQMGFLKGDPTGNGVKVAFYRNQYEDGKPLRQRALDSASETAPVALDVTGFSKIIVRLTCTNEDLKWRTPSDDVPSFGLLDAHFE